MNLTMNEFRLVAVGKRRAQSSSVLDFSFIHYKSIAFAILGAKLNVIKWGKVKNGKIIQLRFKVKQKWKDLCFVICCCWWWLIPHPVTKNIVYIVNIADRFDGRYFHSVGRMGNVWMCASDSINPFWCVCWEHGGSVGSTRSTTSFSLLHAVVTLTLYTW